MRYDREKGKNHEGECPHGIRRGTRIVMRGAFVPMEDGSMTARNVVGRAFVPMENGKIVIWAVMKKRRSEKYAILLSSHRNI